MNLPQALSHCALIALVALAPPAATAQEKFAPANDRLATAQVLMKATGLSHRIALMQSAHATARTPMPAQMASNPLVQGMQRTFDRIYAADRTGPRVAAYIETHLGELDVPAVMAWFKTPLGVRIVALQGQANLAGQDGSSEQRRTTMLDQSSPARRAAIKRVVAAARMTDFKVAELHCMQPGAMTADAAEGFVQLMERYRESLGRSQPQQWAAFERKAELEAVDGLATLSDAELAQYITFLESPAGTAFETVALHGFDATMGAVGRELDEAMVDLAKLVPSPRQK